tara:strand:- start:1641 stop:2129 length:489 start_codon:yes stop_codon:yes gene_type:complete
MYAVSILILIFIVEKTDKIFNYPKLAKWFFSLWLFSHLAGGTFRFAGQRLYDIILIPILAEPFNILKYDQFVHGFCYFVFVLFVYSIVLHISNKKANKFLIAFIAVLAAASIGAINEIIEFITVIFFNAADAVGEYYNTILDLVFNFIGAIIGVFVARKLKN